MRNLISLTGDLENPSRFTIFPIKSVGYLQSLIVKVPWKNLYTEPVIIRIDGLHLLVTPNSAASYDAEAEQAASLDAKKNAIARYEASQSTSKASTPTTPPVPTTPGFAEKLVTQIVKNVQIVISNIHIRYEDVVTDIDMPLGAGITLAGLTVGMLIKTLIRTPSHARRKAIITNSLNLCPWGSPRWG